MKNTITSNSNIRNIYKKMKHLNKQQKENAMYDSEVHSINVIFPTIENFVDNRFNIINILIFIIIIYCFKKFI